MVDVLCQNMSIERTHIWKLENCFEKLVDLSVIELNKFG